MRFGHRRKRIKRAVRVKTLDLQELLKGVRIAFIGSDIAAVRSVKFLSEIPEDVD